jgi:hypothetical protein
MANIETRVLASGEKRYSVRDGRRRAPAPASS